MRHRVAGKQLSRTTSHRKALRRNMAASLFQHGAIRTTEAKAKELRPFVEKLITIAREGTLYARRRVIQMLQDREIYSYDEAAKDYVPDDKTVIQKLFDEVAPRYVDRPGGYTRIIRLSERRIGDAGVQVLLQLVEESSEATTGGKSGGRREKQAGKRYDAVEAVLGKGKKKAEPKAEEAQVDADNDAAEEPKDEAPVAEETPVDEAPVDEAEEKKTEE